MVYLGDKEVFNKGGKTVKKVFLRNGDCPAPAQAGWDSELRGLVENGPVCWKEFGLDGL